MTKFVSEDDIEKLFTFRKWTEKEVALYSPLRAMVKEVAHQVNNTVPDCPHKTRAINALHKAVYLFNTAITLNPLNKE